MDNQLAAYLAVTLAVVATPGAATAVVVRNVLSGGRTAGLAAAAGALAGNGTYAVATVFGVTALLARAPVLLTALRIGGAAYLGLLGGATLWRAWRPSRRDARAASALTSSAATGARAGQQASDAAAMRRAVAPDIKDHSIRAGVVQGLTTNLLNPAVATFYLAILPTFAAGAADPRARFALLAAIHVLMAFAFHSAWAYGLHAMRRIWASHGPRRALDTLTAAALVALAVRIAIGWA